MPIILKGSMKKAESTPPLKTQSSVYKWDSVLRKAVKIEEEKKQEVVQPEPVKVIPKTSFTQVHKEVFVKQEEQISSHYHEEKHGELHKLFNTKSDYLRDILDLETNK